MDETEYVPSLDPHKSFNGKQEEQRRQGKGLSESDGGANPLAGAVVRGSARNDDACEG